jgi:hypothetical protein
MFCPSSAGRAFHALGYRAGYTAFATTAVGSAAAACGRGTISVNRSILSLVTKLC